MLRKLISCLISSLHWLLPPTCLLCGRASLRHVDLCNACEADLPWLKNACMQCAQPLAETISKMVCGSCLIHQPPFNRTIALWHYHQPVDTLIVELKFQQKLTHARLFGQLMAQYIEYVYSHSDRALPECIIPVPLHKKRLQERGYNQALEIARPIAKQFRIPIERKYCQRLRATVAQSLIPATERYKNVKGAFKVRQVKAYKHVAIIDDVMTTGSTISELSLVLRKQGVKQIDVWCCARAS